MGASMVMFNNIMTTSQTNISSKQQTPRDQKWNLVQYVEKKFFIWESDTVDIVMVKIKSDDKNPEVVKEGTTLQC